MWHTRSARALTLALGTLVIIGGLSLNGWTTDDTKQGPVTVPEGSSTPGPDDAPPQPDAWVPASIASTKTFSCPSNKRGFANPVMHYRLCYPDAWGFTDFRQADPLEQVSVKHLTALRLLSGEAFPWKVGDRPFDAVVARNVVDVELNLRQPGAERSAGECEPSTVRRNGALRVLSCTQAYDTTGQPAAAGPITATTFVVPLIQPPVSADAALDLTGSSLLVVVRASSARVAGEVDLGWDLVRSIVPF